MILLRQVKLPSRISGALFLSSMPGRYESLEEAYEAIKANGVTRIISLVPLEEALTKSRRYGEDIKRGTVPCLVQEFPISNFGVPEDRFAFLEMVQQTAHRLSKGERIFAHCGAGIGRTGMLATCVLMALGVDLDTAERLVDDAGSKWDRRPQGILIRWAASKLICEESETSQI